MSSGRWPGGARSRYAASISVLSDLPLPLSIDLQPGAVDDRVERLVNLLRRRVWRDLARRQRVESSGTSRSRPVSSKIERAKPSVAAGGGGRPTGGSARTRWPCRCSGTRPPAGAAPDSPCFQGRLIDPEGERAAIDQGLVVLLPITDAVDQLLGIGSVRHREVGPRGEGRFGSSHSNEAHDPDKGLRPNDPQLFRLAVSE